MTLKAILHFGNRNIRANILYSPCFFFGFFGLFFFWEGGRGRGLFDVVFAEFPESNFIHNVPLNKITLKRLQMQMKTELDLKRTELNKLVKKSIPFSRSPEPIKQLVSSIKNHLTERRDNDLIVLVEFCLNLLQLKIFKIIVLNLSIVSSILTSPICKVIYRLNCRLKYTAAFTRANQLTFLKSHKKANFLS